MSQGIINKEKRKQEVDRGHGVNTSETWKEVGVVICDQNLL